jgi:hypothetical protein
MTLLGAIGALALAAYATILAKRSARTTRAALATMVELIDLVDAMAAAVEVTPVAEVTPAALSSMPAGAGDLSGAAYRAVGAEGGSDGASLTRTLGERVLELCRQGRATAEISRSLNVSLREIELAWAVGESRRTGR